MGRLDDQVALVTGGASGIGRAVVERFLREGAKVAVLDLDPERIDLDVDPETLILIRGDVTSLADNQAAVATAVSAFGHLDVFIGNAGLGDAFISLVELTDATIEKAFDELFAVNVKGYLLGAKATLDALVATRGCMIFTLSNASFYPDGGGPIYTASKHADLGLVRQLAHELAPVVRVNGVAPGGTPSDLRLPGALGTAEDGTLLRAFDLFPGIDDVIRQITPMALAAVPEDHAGAYVLLATREDARAITGAVIETNAGLGIRGVRRVRGGDELQTPEVRIQHGARS